MQNSVKEYLKSICLEIEKQDISEWNKAGETLLNAFNAKKFIWVAGNGGNFANSLHFATDWSKGLFVSVGQASLVRALGDNVATYSAFSNDNGFEFQVSEQLKMLSSPGDVAVLLTAGGGSLNIIRAAETARNLGLTVLGLTGGNGMQHKELFDIHIHVDSNNIQIVEDIHAMFGHAMLKYLESNFTPRLFGSED